MINRVFALSGFFFLIIGCCFAQKRVPFDLLEKQPDGKYYQVNTIPPFTGIAFDVHPPQTEKQKEKAKLDYEAYLRSAQKREEVSFKDGKQDGKAIGWDELGSKIYEANFQAGVQNGIERQWFPNGRIKVEVNYTNGAVDGNAVQYYDNGQKQSEGLFVADKEHGTHHWWFKSGQKDQEINYEMGSIEGALRNWYSNGERKLESEFKNNLPHGKSKEWYNNGQIKGEGMYVEGKEQGTFLAWSRLGKLLDEKVYEYGDLVVERDYRNAGIRTSDGFMQVFNETQTFFSLEVTGEKVKAISTGNISFIVDGKMLEMISYPISSLPMSKTVNPTEFILRSAMEMEVKNIESDLKTSIDVNSSASKTIAGLPYLKWSFDRGEAAPAEGRKRVIVEEHFITVLIKDQILLLSSVLSNFDRKEEIDGLLKRTADSIRLSENRIDLNSLRESIIGSAE